MKSVTLVLLTFTFSAWAAEPEPDVTNLYEVKTEETTKSVVSGGKGQVVIEFIAKDAAHISDEAPLKIELRGQGAKLEKQQLTLRDSIGKKKANQKFADPKFVIPFNVEVDGQASIDAKLTFFVCTENLCARQQKSVKMQVAVTPKV